MPKFQAAHEILEVGKGDAAKARTVEGYNDLSTNFQTSTTFDIICKDQQKLEKIIILTTLHTKMSCTLGQKSIFVHKIQF